MPGGDKGDDVAVDANLELALGAVEEAVDAYLQDPSSPLRPQLLASLQSLDQLIDDSDAYESSTIGSAAFGYSTKGSVIGETSSASAAEEIPGAELQAQTVLVKAAKEEVRAATAETLRQLRAAQHTLAAVRGRDAPTPRGRSDCSLSSADLGRSIPRHLDHPGQDVLVVGQAGEHHLVGTGRQRHTTAEHGVEEPRVGAVGRESPCTLEVGRRDDGSAVGQEEPD
jgi:hypothetical protein